jgi:phosphatidylglycerophosphate synthase
MNPSAFSRIFAKSNIPNFITGGRIFLFLLVLWAISYTYRTHEGLHLLFCVLGGIIYALDWLDGYVARKYGWQSPFGAIFDPAGDKIVAYIYALGIFPIWALAIILFRDIVLSTIRLASLKHGFEFKTSQMGKLRTNILGFGGGVIYALHCWGDYFYFVEFKFGLSHAIIVAITAMTIFNIVKLPNQYMLKLFPRFMDKLGAVVTFVIAAVYPPYSIILSMVWITGYTLWDYGRSFKHEVDKARDTANVRRFLSRFVMYSIMGLLLTGLIIGMLKISTILSIITANAVFTILLIQNFNMIKFKERIRRLKNLRIRNPRNPRNRRRHQP